MENYYKVLDLDNSAQLQDIKKAYKRLALKWHPDRNKSPEAEEMFKKIAEAYEILSDPDKKVYYEKNSKYNFKFKSPSEVFKELFPTLDMNLLKNLSTLIEKLISHSNIDIKEQIYELLNKIKNLSKTDESFTDLMKEYYQYIQKQKNNIQEKSQELIYSFNISLEDYYKLKSKTTTISIIDKCDLCSKSYNQKCLVCKGTIFYTSNRIFELPLNKYELFYKNEGNHLPNYKIPGDLTIYLDDKPHSKFERINSYDLYYIHEINAFQINKTNKIIIKHLDLTLYEITLKENELDLVKIYNLGLPNFCGSWGDLYLKIKIIFDVTKTTNNTITAINTKIINKYEFIDNKNLLDIKN